MTPRPRSTPDDLVIQAAARVLTRRGTEHMRLADVAVESGLAPATLVQRFGSREGILDRVGRTFVAAIDDAFHPPAPHHLARMAMALANLDMVTHLRFFSARPFHAPAYSLELRKQIAFALNKAVEQGELPPCPVADLARDIQLAYYGLVTAAILEGTPFGAEDIEALMRASLADV